MRILWASIALLCAVFTAFPAAAAWQELPPLRQAVASFVAARTGDLPGKVRVSVGTIDPRLRLSRCRNPEAFLPPGARLWGNSTIGIRCNGPAYWSIYVPVEIKVIAPVVVSSRPLAQGQILARGDLVVKKVDIAAMPRGVITDPARALGKTLTTGVPSGYPLRPDMLRAPTVILRGQTVKIVSRGPGFKVSSEAKALANASAGQVVSVRIRSGQVISGIAKPGGVVEVAF